MNNNIKVMDYDSFADVCAKFRELNEVEFTPLSEPDRLGIVKMLYRGIHMNIKVPTVQNYGDQWEAQIVHTGSTSRRLWCKILLHSGAHRIPRDASPSAVEEKLADPNGWYLLGFWGAYFLTLLEAHATASKMNRLNPQRATNIFNAKVTALITEIPIVSSQAHIAFRSKALKMGIPISNRSKRPSFGCAVLNLPQQSWDVVRDTWYKKAIEIGCALEFTPKGFPGEFFLRIPGGFSTTLVKMNPFIDHSSEKRAPREAMSWVQICTELVTEDNLDQSVTSELGAPVAMRGRYKCVNVCYLDSDDLVPLVDGQRVNADQVALFQWAEIDQMFRVRVPKTVSYDHEEGYTVETVKGFILEQYGVDVTPELQSTPESDGFRFVWNCKFMVEESGFMAFKATTTSAIKGITTPVRTYRVEKRPNENFYRPVYVEFAASAARKKAPWGGILYTLASRLQSPELRLNRKRSVRENYTKEKNEILEALWMEGDTGVSEIGNFVPNPEGEEVVVQGFTEDAEGNITPCPGRLGVLHGYVIPVRDSKGQVATAICGEEIVIRCRQDEDFGRLNRSPDTGNGISCDPFTARPGFQLPEDPDARELIDFTASLQKAIAALPPYREAY